MVVQPPSLRLAGASSPVATPKPAPLTADFRRSQEVSFSSKSTQALPGSDTSTFPRPGSAASARVTLLTHPPQVIPVTFIVSVCMVVPQCWRAVAAKIRPARR